MAYSIEVRKIPFGFEDCVGPVWHPDHLEWSHMVNGASLTMPYLEPFLIKNVREAISLLDDPQVVADAKGFVGQEAQHFTNHRRWNEFLKDHGYAELADVEEGYQRGYEVLSKRSLAWRLAYTAGFETMTMGLTEWLINERDLLFKGADQVVTSLVLWHMVEETEHKCVAYDVYQAVSGAYWLRIWGLLYGSLHLGFLSRRAYRAMLIRDGKWYSLSSRIRLWRRVGRFFLNVGPSMVRALAPGFHPDNYADPAWIDRWRDVYAQHDEDYVPLLRTNSATIEPAR